MEGTTKSLLVVGMLQLGKGLLKVHLSRHSPRPAGLVGGSGTFKRQGLVGGLPVSRGHGFEGDAGPRPGLYRCSRPP